MNDTALSPQVSVYVSIYNASWERIRASLNSIIMQKGIDFEIIVIDDCSTVKHSDEIKDFSHVMTDTNVSTDFADLCMNRE